MTGVVTIGALLSPGAAETGQCPAAERVEDGLGPSALLRLFSEGETDTVLAAIDLGKEKVALKGRQFRLRRLVVEPDGQVAWHSHADRPALIFVLSGSVVEHASTCAVPIVHNAGEAAMESSGLAHWWKNAADKPVVLLSADIVEE
jgi:quercetin dioxygenase-like cupin family protein